MWPDAQPLPPWDRPVLLALTAATDPHSHVVEDEFLPLAVPVAAGARGPRLRLWPWLVENVFRVVVSCFLNDKQHDGSEKLASWLEEQPITQNSCVPDSTLESVVLLFKKRKRNMCIPVLKREFQIQGGQK